MATQCVSAAQSCFIALVVKVNLCLAKTACREYELLSVITRKVVPSYVCFHPVVCFSNHSNHTLALALSSLFIHVYTRTIDHLTANMHVM